MKRRIVWINIALALAVVAAGVGVYFWLFSSPEQVATGRTVAVQSGMVSETITATGTVATAGSLNLSFSATGTVRRVPVTAGDTVSAGDLLAALDGDSAREGLATARSSYVQAVTGAEKSTLTVSQAQQAVQQAQSNAKLNATSYDQAVATAKRSLATAKSSWSDSCLDPNGTCPNAEAWSQLRAAEGDIASAKTAYDQAVQSGSASQVTANLKLNQAQVNADAAQATQTNDCNTYGSSSNQCTSAVAALRSARQQLELAQDSVSTLNVQVEQSLTNAAAKVTQANVALKKLQSSLQKNAIDSVASARDALASAELNQRKGTESDQQAISNAQDALATARLSTQAVTAGGSTLTSGQAGIDVAAAGVKAAKQAVAATRLTAPVAGTVAAVDVSKGDAVQAGTTVITLLPTGDYEVTASFAEADATKLAVGQKATVTFDALANATATGTVAQVDLIPTTGNNVTSYGATITLDSAPDGLKQGMSASVVVTTNEASDVLWVPSAAVTTAGGQSTVTVRANGVDTVTPVTVGLVGDSGTEVTSGLTAGQQVVISTSGAGGGSGFPTGGFPGGGLGGAGGPPAGGPPAGGGIE